MLTGSQSGAAGTMKVIAGFVLLLVALCLIPAFAQQGPPSTETARLAALGQLWGTAKFFHPFLAHEDIDWDGALVRAIPQVRAARTPDEYRAAVSGMLRALNDPATFVEAAAVEAAATRPSDPSPSLPISRDTSLFRLVDGYVIVNVPDWANTASAQGAAATMSQLREMLGELDKARGIVLDCRYDGIAILPPTGSLWNYLDLALPSMVHGSLSLGTEGYRQYDGYFSSGFITRTPGVIFGKAKDKKPIAVLLDEATPLGSLPIFGGLQSYGAKILQVGSRDYSSADSAISVVLTDGLRVKLRVSEFVNPNGRVSFQPDVEITREAGSGDAGIHAAVTTMSDAASTSSAKSRPAVAALMGQRDDPYGGMPLPTDEYRLLALFRFWNVINYFYPYKHLMDQPWRSVLTDFIPRFLENKSPLDYERTLAEMIARVPDSHVHPTNTGVGSRLFGNLQEYLGTFAPPVRLASAGGRVTVVEVLNGAGGQNGGLGLGDVILAVDSEPIARRIESLAQFGALSTPQSAYAYVYPRVLRGARDSKAQLRVEGADGKIRDVVITRTAPLGTVTGMLRRKQPVYEILPNGYGYIDLDRLQAADAQKAMDALIDTPGLIFDMRGYPNGTAWAIAPRLTEKESVTAALYRRPLLSALNLEDQGVDIEASSYRPSVFFEQKLPARRGSVYKGKVVMLINEFAVSQSEHTCLFFESATDVTFIGSPTDGAEGDVTNMVLPGGISVQFSGEDVRHADGRQVHRVGIHPHIRVEPTPQGIRDQRDEVLEAAFKHLDRILNK